MNPVSVLRLLSRKSGLCRGIARSIPQHCKMSTSASISELQRDKETFQDVFPTICEMVTKRSKFSEVPELADWLKKVLEYNLQGGKLSRGLTTTFAYETLATRENFSEENLKISRILGWCVEMEKVATTEEQLEIPFELPTLLRCIRSFYDLHAYFLVMDDIMDGSTKRRGLPCWYTLPDVGINAINDSILIHACIFETLKTFSSHVPLYPQIIDLFNESLLYTTMGQHMDISMAHMNVKDYSLFTVERYSSIIKYKTSYYTYKLPVTLGMLLANISDVSIHKKAEEICLQIGHLFQMQDDFIDCYGAEHAGKDGTDIQERKCSWLAVTALSRCTQKQRVVFESCYGSSEPAHIERIKRLYEELEMPAAYKLEERQRYDEVLRCVQQLPANVLSPDLFIKLLNMINKRKI